MIILRKIIQYLSWDYDIHHLLEKLNKFKASEVIMLTADMLVTDLKMLNPAIEALMRQGIQITSVLDNVIIQNKKTIFK